MLINTASVYCTLGRYSLELASYVRIFNCRNQLTSYVRILGLTTFSYQYFTDDSSMSLLMISSIQSPVAEYESRSWASHNALPHVLSSLKCSDMTWFQQLILLMLFCQMLTRWWLLWPKSWEYFFHLLVWCSHLHVCHPTPRGHSRSLQQRPVPCFSERPRKFGGPADD